MRRARALAAGVALFSLGLACNRTVLIDSEPSGAIVRVNGQVRGTTPFRARLEYTAFTHYEIVLEKEGYRTATSRLPMELDAGSLICGTICWPFLLVVQRPSNTVFVLERASASAPETNPVVPATPEPTPDVESGATSRTP